MKQHILRRSPFLFEWVRKQTEITKFLSNWHAEVAQFNDFRLLSVFYCFFLNILKIIEALKNNIRREIAEIEPQL